MSATLSLIRVPQSGNEECVIVLITKSVLLIQFVQIQRPGRIRNPAAAGNLDTFSKSDLEDETQGHREALKYD